MAKPNRPTVEDAEALALALEALRAQEDLAFLVEALNGASVEWPDTQEARDVREFAEQVRPHWAAELSAIDHAIGAHRYQGRILAYEKQAKAPAGQAWQLVDVDYADALVLQKGSQHIQALAQFMAAQNPQNMLTAWIHYLHTRARTPLFMVYLRHGLGWESLFLFSPTGDSFRIPIPPGKLFNQALTKLSPLREPMEQSLWRHVLGTHIREARNMHSVALSNAFKARFGLDLTTEVWNFCCEQLLASSGFLAGVLEGARHVATGPTKEAHFLLIALVDSITRASISHRESLEQMRRDQKRELTRRVNEHTQLSRAYKGLAARAARQDKELAQLKAQLNSSRTEDSPKEASLGHALRDLF